MDAVRTPWAHRSAAWRDMFGHAASLAVRVAGARRPRHGPFDVPPNGRVARSMDAWHDQWTRGVINGHAAGSMDTWQVMLSGSASLELGEPDMALSTFRAVLKTDPDNRDVKAQYR